MHDSNEHKSAETFNHAKKCKITILNRTDNCEKIAMFNFNCPNLEFNSGCRLTKQCDVRSRLTPARRMRARITGNIECVSAWRKQKFVYFNKRPNTKRLWVEFSAVHRRFFFLHRSSADESFSASFSCDATHFYDSSISSTHVSRASRRRVSGICGSRHCRRNGVSMTFHLKRKVGIAFSHCYFSVYYYNPYQYHRSFYHHY